MHNACLACEPGNESLPNYADRSILCNITGLSLECTTKSPKRVNFINYMIRNELVLPQFDRPTDLVLMRFGRNYACTACMGMKLFNKTDVKNLNK